MFQEFRVKNPLKYLMTFYLWFLVFVAVNFVLMATTTVTTNDYCMRNGTKFGHLKGDFENFVELNAYNCPADNLT